MALRRRRALMQRRQVLLDTISCQRQQVALTATRWEPVLRAADQAWVVAGFLHSHKVAVAALAGIFMIRRKGVISLAKGAWRIWKTWRYMSETAKKFTSR
ncbi:MAG: YqjK family protein [Gallionella sp.]|nr:YqjK family protein [Gallionella sp.]